MIKKKKFLDSEDNLEHTNFYLRKHIKSLEKELKEYKTENGKVQEFFTGLKSAIINIKPKKISIINKFSKVSSPVSATLLISDWHVGEVTDSGKIENVCEYNYSIAIKRVQTLTQNFIDFCKLQQNVYKIKEVVIPCIGDMVSGDIHDELKITNEWPVTVQVTKCSELFSLMVSEISRFFPVRIEYVSWDNHSRLTKKMQFKQGGENSYNYITGYISREKLSKISNIEFNLYSQDKALIDIQGFNYLIEHGGHIKGWAGLPWYGIERLVGLESKARMNDFNRRFSKLIIGHFHQPLKTLYYLVNGSLSGTNELDHAVGRFCKPCQVAFFVHPKHSEFNWSEFWL